MKSPTDEMAMFFTRKPGGDGIKMTLFDPATGKDTEHWIRIRSVDSEEFEVADTIARRRTREIEKLKTEEEKAILVNEITRDLIASLVMSWSFSMPCTHDNVVDFLRRAPHIANAINTMAGLRSLFMKSSLQSSEPTPLPPSNSTESPAEVATVEEST